MPEDRYLQYHTISDIFCLFSLPLATQHHTNCYLSPLCRQWVMVYIGMEHTLVSDGLGGVGPAAPSPQGKIYFLLSIYYIFQIV